jgi:hypothetical protein
MGCGLVFGSVVGLAGAVLPARLFAPPPGAAEQVAMTLS